MSTQVFGFDSRGVCGADYGAYRRAGERRGPYAQFVKSFEYDNMRDAARSPAPKGYGERG
jgi:hypothetical protein